MNVQADRKLSNNSRKSLPLGTSGFISLRDFPTRTGETGLKAGFCSQVGNALANFEQLHNPANYETQ